LEAFNIQEVGVVSQRQQQANRLQELGDFLRTRRARLTPEAAGLPRGSRRKTPGLRRAEVAQLVGVSVDWYTWLEQGRAITPSTQVLERLAQTLRLDMSERTHLFLLAQQQPPPALALEPESVSPALQRFIDQFGTRPAFVSGRRWDVLARNAAGGAVFVDDRRMTGPHERNTIWNVFTNPQARHFIVNWEDDARYLLAQLRSSYARYPGDAQLAELIHDLLRASPEFRAWWPDHEVRGGQERRKILNHPQVGHLVLERLIFEVLDTPNLKVIVYTPLDEEDTPRKLEYLLEQWYQQQGRGQAPATTAHRPVQAQPADHDTVGGWLAACCQRAEGAWVANSAIMASYVRWCQARGYEAKKAKSVSQALAGHGFEIGVNKRVMDEQRRPKMTRGVRGLVLC
jgi:transcriptional regulator with XRE-family HTH domain